MFQKYEFDAYTTKILYFEFLGDPCETDKDGCEHECSFDGEKTTCSCPDKFVLKADKKSCIGW